MRKPPQAPTCMWFSSSRSTYATVSWICGGRAAPAGGHVHVSAALLRCAACLRRRFQGRMQCGRAWWMCWTASAVVAACWADQAALDMVPVPQRCCSQPPPVPPAAPRCQPPSAPSTSASCCGALRGGRCHSAQLAAASAHLPPPFEKLDGNQLPRLLILEQLGHAKVAWQHRAVVR